MKLHSMREIIYTIFPKKSLMPSRIETKILRAGMSPFGPMAELVDETRHLGCSVIRSIKKNKRLKNF